MVLALLFEKGAIVGHGRVVQRGWIVVVRPTAVENLLYRNQFADLGDAGLPGDSGERELVGLRSEKGPRPAAAGGAA